MKRLALSMTLLAMIAFTGCKNQNKDADEMDELNDSTQVDTLDNEDEMVDEAKTLTVNMESKSGSNATGTVTFTQENGMVKMEGKFGGLKPGTHAIHLHEKADCSAADGKSAGGHWNPTNQKHGKWGDANGYHRGDIGNFEADADGNGTVSMQTDEWCIGCDDANMDITGKAVIVHEGTDDFVSQPSGDAGDRVACGGIVQ